MLSQCAKCRVVQVELIASAEKSEEAAMDREQAHLPAPVVCEPGHAPPNTREQAPMPANGGIVLKL